MLHGVYALQVPGTAVQRQLSKLIGSVFFRSSLVDNFACIDDEVAARYVERLFPLASVVTPNLHEADLPQPPPMLPSLLADLDKGFGAG